MPTVRQAVERGRGSGLIPDVGRTSLDEVRRTLGTGPSVRALLARLHTAEHKPWAVLLCRFKGEATTPETDDFYREMFSLAQGGLHDYWRDVSLGAIDLTGTRVFGPIELDLKRADAGVGSGHARRESIDAAIAAARREGIDPVTGFVSQLVVLHHNWTRDDVPEGLDWKDPTWGKYWIDGSADGDGRVCLTPPHNGNITAHEMGHGFGMNHDVGADFTTHYADPCCIMSQNGPFTHPRWQKAFGPALCLPHLIQRGWMYDRRVYTDDGGWVSWPEGITLPLAPTSRPGARANLGIKLPITSANGSWDYYLEYVTLTDWNRGVPGGPYLFIRRMGMADVGSTPIYLGALGVGRVGEFFEPSGNVLFTAEETDLPGPVLRINARRL